MLFRCTRIPFIYALAVKWSWKRLLKSFFGQFSVNLDGICVFCYKIFFLSIIYSVFEKRSNSVISLVTVII